MAMSHCSVGNAPPFFIMHHTPFTSALTATLSFFQIEEVVDYYSPKACGRYDVRLKRPLVCSECRGWFDGPFTSTGQVATRMCRSVATHSMAAAPSFTARHWVALSPPRPQGPMIPSG